MAIIRTFFDIFKSIIHAIIKYFEKIFDKKSSTDQPQKNELVQSGTRNIQVNGNSNTITAYVSLEPKYIDQHNAAEKIRSTIRSAKYQINSYFSKSPPYAGNIQSSWHKDKSKLIESIKTNASQFSSNDQEEHVKLAKQLMKASLDNKSEINDIFTQIESLLNKY